MAEMHTTTMRASITAYSTAVGPSSLFRKLTTERRVCDNMGTVLSLVQQKGSTKIRPSRPAGQPYAGKHEVGEPRGAPSVTWVCQELGEEPGQMTVGTDRPHGRCRSGVRDPGHEPGVGKVV